MPSGGLVEIDVADADNGVFDASLATAASSSSDDTSNLKEHAVSQSQDDGNDDMDVEEAPAQVSPMPPKRASMVTPRSTRKAPTPTSAGGKSKKIKKSSAAKKDNNDNGPATPPKNDGSRSSAAVATPGDGEDSATKKKKDTKVKDKKPSTTLHSFFAKVDPSAKKKKDAVKSSSVKVSAKAKAPSTSAAAPAAEKKNKGTAKKSTTKEPSTKVAEKPAAKETVSNDKPKKKAAKKTKVIKNAGEGEDIATPATAKKAKKTAASKPSAKKSTKKDVVSHEPSQKELSPKPSQHVSRKPPVARSVSEDPVMEELDDSPTYAVAMASRTMSAGAGSLRRRNSGGKKTKQKVIAVSDSAKEVVEIVEVGEKSHAVEVVEVSEKSETEDTNTSDSFDDQVDKEEERNVSDTAEVVIDPVEQHDDAMDVDGSEAAGDTAKDSEANTVSGDVIVVDCEEEKASVPEETVQEEPVEQESDAMNVGENVAEGDTAKVIDANDASDDVIDVDCNEVTTSAPEESVHESVNNDDEDSNGDATVAMEEVEAAAEKSVPGDVCAVEENNDDEGSDDDAAVTMDEPEASAEKSAVPSDVCIDEDTEVPTEVEKPEINNESTDKQEEPSEEGNGEIVVVDVAQKSVLEELPSNDNAKEALNDEVEVVDEPKDTMEKSAEDAPKETMGKPTKSKKKTKTTPKPRKKPASASANKSTKKKKSTPASKTKGMPSIMAGFKKQAATSPKRKSKVSTTPTKTQAPSSSTSAPVTSKDAASAEKSDSAPSAKSPASANSNLKMAAVEGKAPASNINTAAVPSKPIASKVDVSTAAPVAKLSEENASRLRHYTTLREKYVSRATELGNRPTSDDFEEESLTLDGAEGLAKLDKGSVEVVEDGGFPDKLLIHLQLIVQGRSMPLSALAKQALDELSPFITDARPLTIESISSKIKLLAQRKSYLSGKPPATSSEKPTPISKLDCFENAEECYMWRWELSSIDLLPNKEATKVKKARTTRKKLQGHHKAIVNLIAAIDKATTWLQNSASKPSTPASTAAGEKLTAKVSDMEEKVLKFEREEEKLRMLKEAKLQKAKSKTGNLSQKDQEKRNEKEHKKAEAAKKKAEAAKERESAKLKKDEEKLKKKLEEEEKESKRKARMMSFFSKGSVKKKQKVAASTSKEASKTNVPTFDVDAFRKQIDSWEEHVQNPFAKPSQKSKASRRKTAQVRVSVFVTVLSENAFAPQPYDEERIITVPNRYKFLGFCEDVRPPYRGTWSKTSKLVTGRRPLGKDTKYLDYENDSEDEWEEGDDDEGEDLQDGNDGADEEDDMQEDEDNDGFIAAEDDLGVEGDDDETNRELRKKNLSCKEANGLKACVVAPRMGGLSHESFEDDMECVIEGFSTHDAMDVLTSHVGCIITPDVSNICLDAFPPSDSTKDTSQTKKEPSTQNKEMTLEAQTIMAKFVHNSTVKSKETLVTELLKAHPTITNSRAQALRELDVIAEKMRNLGKGGGVVWEVKGEHLKKLGLKLKKKDLNKAPKESSPPKATEEKTKKEKKDPNAPKRNGNAYMFYSNANRSKVRAENPNLQYNEITKLLSEKFKALTAEERAPWDQNAAADKERYQKEMAEYSSTKTSAAAVSSAADKKDAASTTKALSSSPKPSAAVAADGQAKKPSSGKKRKKPVVSKASAKLLASFMSLNKKPKTSS